MSIIGLGLFAFIAEEAFRSCDAIKNQQHQQIGEVLGEKISYDEFQKLVDEYSEAIKMTQGKENLTDEEMNQVRDMVWNSYVQSKLIESDAAKLGLTVTDDEVRNILNEGTNQLLLQSPFVNQQTGRFDANMLKQFMSEYKKNTNPQYKEQMDKIYNYWNFIEKTLRQQTLAQKYQTLLAATFMSNPVEAKQAFNEQTEESNIQLAAFPYSSIQDKDVEVSDADLKDKYNELKPRFKQYEETRDIKYVSVHVAASAADKAALVKQTNDFAAQLATAEDPADIVRKSNSTVAYLGVPVDKNAYPMDIQNLLDSISVGSTTAIKENAMDNTLNVIRLISKSELPDSIEFQAIQVGGETPEAAHTRADSIYKALSADASQWDAIAKKYGQTGAKTWLTTAQYQSAPSIDADTKKYLNTLNTVAVNQLTNVEMTSGNIIIKVTDRKAMATKYVAAVIKTPINFSKGTYSTAYNKFSQFVSSSKTAEELEKNAKKSGYNVEEAKDVRTSQHYVANVRSTHDALKWIFSEAKEGQISPLYECGDNDNLLVCVVTKIHPKGYRGLDDEQVKEMIKQEVLRDKKAEKIMAKINGVKNIKAAQSKGGKVATVNQITFAAPVFVQLTGASEPALSGAVAATKAGQFSSHAVKGLAGVYLFQVTGKSNRGGKFDAKTEEAKLTQRYMQMAGNFMQELYIKANVVDNRYLFF